jgi:DNA polymerase gamma 1
MLLLIRAGRSSRPCASFVRLAKHRAHRRQESSISSVRWRGYTTQADIVDEDATTESGSLSSKDATALRSKLVN